MAINMCNARLPHDFYRRSPPSAVPMVDASSSSLLCSCLSLLGHIQNQPWSSLQVPSMRSVPQFWLDISLVASYNNKWASSIRLVKKPTGFEAVAQVPWEQKIKYKFVVDGEWLVHENQPTEVDPGGFVNNVYTSPPKPITPPALEIPLEPEEPTAVKTNNYKTNDDNVVVEVTENTPQNTQSLTGTTDGKIAGAEPRTSDASGFLSDLASTIVARDGTSSALAYVASGLGAAIHSAVGVDPINISKVGLSVSLP